MPNLENPASAPRRSSRSFMQVVVPAGLRAPWQPWARLKDDRSDRSGAADAWSRTAVQCLDATVQCLDVSRVLHDCYMPCKSLRRAQAGDAFQVTSPLGGQQWPQ